MSSRVWGFPYAAFMSPACLPTSPLTLASSSCSSLHLSHAPRAARVAIPASCEPGNQKQERRSNQGSARDRISKQVIFLSKPDDCAWAGPDPLKRQADPLTYSQPPSFVSPHMCSSEDDNICQAVIVSSCHPTVPFVLMEETNSG